MRFIFFCIHNGTSDDINHYAIAFYDNKKSQVNLNRYCVNDASAGFARCKLMFIYLSHLIF